MSAICLKAHFDGRSIQLDEPYTLGLNDRLLVTVLPEPPGMVVCEDVGWASLGNEGLQMAYGLNEPDYSEADVLS